jgi:uncharacterized protein Usg
MHTNTFQSRFKVGDKITDGKQTINIGHIGLDTRAGVYYREPEHCKLYFESDLTDYHLAPRFAVGEKVWRVSWQGIVEDVIESFSNNFYHTKNSLSCYIEDHLFPDAESCRAAIKVIPLA